jgi:hypothetical protein
MTVPKRHHYLPQFYLNEFTQNDVLAVYDRKTNEYRNQTPINTAVEKDFYSIIDDAGKKDTSIESMLSEVETNASLVIEKLNNHKDVTFQERIDLSQFIALLIGRTPEFDATFKSLQDNLTRRISKMMFHSVEQTKDILEKHNSSDTEISEASAKELYDFVQSDQYDIEFSRINTLDVMLHLGESLAKYFCKMNWVVFHTPRDASFITTDSPLVIVPSPNFPERPFYRGVGIATPGAQKFISLTNSCTLVMLDSGKYTLHQVVSRKYVREINLILISRCYRFVIGRDKGLLKYLIEKSGLDQSEWKPRMAMG